MALISCPECGKEVSDTAKKCPNCGYQIKKRNKKLHILVGIVVVVLIIIAVCYFVFIKPTENNQKHDSTDSIANNEIEEVDIVKEQEELYSRYVDIAVNNTRQKLMHPSSMVLNKVIVNYTIKGNELTAVNVAIDFSSENNYGMMQRGYSTNVAYPSQVDDPNYMNTYVTSDSEHYNHYYMAVTNDNYLREEFVKLADEYYEGTWDGITDGYFTYDIENIE